MNVSVRQERIITVKDGTTKIVYEQPYTYETDCHKHRQANIVWCGRVKSGDIKTHIICIEYYIK